MTPWAMPASFRASRPHHPACAPISSEVVEEGQFTSLDIGITFHYREKAGEALLGIFMQDRRDKKKPATYIAERGQTIETTDRPIWSWKTAACSVSSLVRRPGHRGVPALRHRPEPVRLGR